MLLLFCEWKARSIKLMQQWIFQSMTSERKGKYIVEHHKYGLILDIILTNRICVCHQSRLEYYNKCEKNISESFDSHVERILRVSAKQKLVINLLYPLKTNLSEYIWKRNSKIANIDKLYITFFIYTAPKNCFITSSNQFISFLLLVEYYKTVNVFSITRLLTDYDNLSCMRMK